MNENGISLRRHRIVFIIDFSVIALPFLYGAGIECDDRAGFIGSVQIVVYHLLPVTRRAYINGLVMVASFHIRPSSIKFFQVTRFIVIRRSVVIFYSLTEYIRTAPGLYYL